LNGFGTAKMVNIGDEGNFRGIVPASFAALPAPPSIATSEHRTLGRGRLGGRPRWALVVDLDPELLALGGVQASPEHVPARPVPPSERRLLPGGGTGQSGDDPVGHPEADRLAVLDDPEQGALRHPDHLLDRDQAEAPVGVLDDRDDQVGRKAAREQALVAARPRSHSRASPETTRSAVEFAQTQGRIESYVSLFLCFRRVGRSGVADS
jgi:hypothetical protein